MSIHGLLRFAPMRLRRAWCRRRHRGLHLVVSQQGHGSRRCSLCGVGFTSLADAGRLHLSSYERQLSEGEREQVERLATVRERFDGTSYRLVRGGLFVGDGDQRRIVGGETLKIVRLRPGSSR